jgi:alginate O-acetyltransferase complex protein AlgI
MLFNSCEFAAFFLIVFLLYYLPALRRFQVVVLAGASLIFYYQGAGGLTILLLVSMLTNALISYAITHQASSSRIRAILFWFGVLFNLLILCFFKYAGLAVTSLGSFLPPGTSSFTRALTSIPLPLGISFYCLGSISLVVDCAKGTFKKQSNLPDTIRDTGVFVSFFPHLISGPILRASNFFPQIGNKPFREIDWYTGLKWMIVGYFLKLFVADNLAAHSLKFPYFLLAGTWTNLAFLYAYSAQIFADFAGYSFIALGLAKLLGYDIINNFNAPYISQSLREFWRRWHISLSSWLRDYLFIPLGGSRRSQVRTSCNILFVMVLGGLWHGASWTFAMWGGLHGAALVLERQLLSKLTLPSNAFWSLGKMFITFTFVSTAWICFILHDMNHIWLLFQHLCSDVRQPVNSNALSLILFFGLPVFFLHMFQLAKEHKIMQLVLGHKYFRISALGTMIFLTILNSGPPHAFIYFQF